MERISENDALLSDIWQKIPPEEKVKLTSEAQSTAISAVVVFMRFGWAIAVGLKQPWYLWGSFLVVPILFQALSKKAWHTVRPRAIVEYTAARATATYYASEVNGKELLPSLQFKGTLEREIPAGFGEDPDLHDPSAESRGPLPVWVTIFPDSVVMFSETLRGAKPQLACSIFEELSVTPEGFDEDALDQRRLLFSLRNEDGEEHRWILRSPYTSQITACERKLQNAIERRNEILAQSVQSTQSTIKDEIRAALAG